MIVFICMHMKWFKSTFCTTANLLKCNHTMTFRIVFFPTRIKVAAFLLSLLSNHCHILYRQTHPLVFMEFDSKYAVLHVAGIKRYEGKPQRCLISLATDDNRRFAFFSDEHDAARIALHAFPQQSGMPKVFLWTELMEKATASFGIYTNCILVKRDENGTLYADAMLENFGTGEIHYAATNIIDGVMYAAAIKCKIIIENDLLDEITESERHEKAEVPPISELSDDAIEKQLEEAVKAENYEKASVLRDELQRRRNGLHTQ